MATRLVLVHSPLVGPLTWTMIADALRRMGWEVHVPTLDQPESSAGPFWPVHVQSVIRDLAGDPSDTRCVLAGHSGAGPLLPAIARDLDRPVAAYLFVDAGLPHGGRPRMAGQFGSYLSELYAAGERFPNWTDDDLASILPDPEIRARVLADLRPQPFEFWKEPLPEIEDWPDAPCAYLLFSPAYDEDARQARDAGWPVWKMAGGHFQMLVEPDAVAAAMLGLLDELSIRAGDD